MNNEAANIGFAASIDTGMSVAGTPLKANFQCEQFTLWNRLGQLQLITAGVTGTASLGSVVPGVRSCFQAG